MPANDATVAADSYLTLHYRISTPEGEDFVSTFDMGPATLQMGSGQLAGSLEACLMGLAAGEKRIFDLPPEAAFGQSNPRLVERIAREALPAGMELREGALLEFTSPSGAGFAGFVRQLAEDVAVIDFNHPLAGKHVRFEVELIGIL